MPPLVMLTSQFLTLTLVLSTLRYTQTDPLVIVFTFILLCFFRLMTVEILVGLSRLAPSWRPFLAKVCRPPAPGQKPEIVYEKGSHKPSGDFGYFIFILIPAVIAFVFMAKGEGGETLESLQTKGLWILVYGLVYWVQDLLGRAPVVDFKAQRTINLAYNMENVTILFFAVWLGGFSMGLLFQFHIQVASPWLVCGPLILLKHADDLYRWRRHGRGLSGKGIKLEVG